MIRLTRWQLFAYAVGLPVGVLIGSVCTWLLFGSPIDTFDLGLLSGSMVGPAAIFIQHWRALWGFRTPYERAMDGVLSWGEALGQGEEEAEDALTKTPMGRAGISRELADIASRLNKLMVSSGAKMAPFPQKVSSRAEEIRDHVRSLQSEIIQSEII